MIATASCKHPAAAPLTRRSALRTIALVILGAGVIAVFVPEILAPASQTLMSSAPVIHVGLTTFAAMCVQALPLVLVGSLASATLGMWMTPERWARIIPNNRVGGVVVAILAGAAMPTCECSSVLVAQRMIYHQVRPEVALTFMVAAPSLNPLVVVSTAVAFGGCEMVWARLSAGVLTVVAVAAATTLASASIAGEVMAMQPSHDGCHCQETSHGLVFQRWLAAVTHDGISATTFLVIGGAIAAVGTAVVPASAMATISENVWVSIVLMAVIAIIASLCSMGDAFVAASFTGLHPASLLAFLVVGPVIDLKLAAMMDGLIGLKATRAVAGAGLVGGMAAAVVIAWLVGWL